MLLDGNKKQAKMKDKEKIIEKENKENISKLNKVKKQNKNAKRNSINYASKIDLDIIRKYSRKQTKSNWKKSKSNQKDIKEQVYTKIKARIKIRKIKKKNLRFQEKVPKRILLMIKTLILVVLTKLLQPQKFFK